MKLKKIASLALAGIMAVSMLAGCKYGEGSSSSSSSSSEATVTSTASEDVASILNAKRSDHAKNVLEMSYEASSSLEEMLKAIVEDEYGKASNELEALLTSGNYTVAAVATKDNKFVSELSDKVVGGIENNWNNTTLPTAEGVYKFARFYTVGGGYTAKEAANLVANFNVNTASTGTEAYLPLASGSNRADYTAEVAAVKMTSKANTDKSVWFIVVLYTQTVTTV